MITMLALFGFLGCAVIIGSSEKDSTHAVVNVVGPILLLVAIVGGLKHGVLALDWLIRSGNFDIIWSWL